MNTLEGDAPSDRSPKTALSSDARIIMWSVITVIVLVAAAVGFTFVRGPMLDPSTPEGVVQHYLQAVVEGRRSDARSYLSDRLQRECESEMPRYRSRDAYRIEWIETVVEGSTATVETSVAQQDPWIFGTYYEFYTSFTLELGEGGWRITDQEWPWYGCSEAMLDREAAQQRGSDGDELRHGGDETMPGREAAQPKGLA